MTADIELPDAWPEGLRIGIKSLSCKTVKRAVDAADVLRVVLRHNLRQDNADHRHRSRIDAGRTSLNTVLFGSADPELGVKLALDALDRLRLKPPTRTDGVIAFEVVMQPPAGADAQLFWSECLHWLHATYEVVLSVVVHRDQQRPHAQCVVLAVQEGRLAGRDMQRGEFGVPRLRRAFLAHIRATLGLRPDRPKRTLSKIVAGAKRKHVPQAAGALIEQHVSMGMDVDGHGHSTAEKPMSITPMSRIGDCAPPAQTSADRLASLVALMRRVMLPMSPCPKPSSTPGSDAIGEFR
ncbi:MAG: Plasmid recombination enzyme [Pseudomonadota bacterium]